jgi:ketosteroid isomerase-like protein
MAQDNVDLVRLMFDRWNAGDVDGWLEFWHADAEWVSEPFQAFDGSARRYQGRDDLRRFPAEVLEGFADLGQVERPEFRDLGDRVLVLADYRARAGVAGPEVTTPMAWLLELRDGKIVRGRDFLDQQEALEAG